MAEIILITGGARSGKSGAALRLANGYSPKVFIATAEAFDNEMQERITRHKAERGIDWSTIEAPLDLAKAIESTKSPQAAIVVDCLTVWLSNLMFHDESITEDSLPCSGLLDALRQSPVARIILVTNEVGMGIVPDHPLGRRFRDIAGRLNQRVGALAHQVIFVVCGQCLTIKSSQFTQQNNNESSPI
jgi:adenosylcobinamide kinase/adenosylcobinamide-phosphate guanylyltransferase